MEAQQSPPDPEPEPKAYPPYKDCGEHDSFADGFLPMHATKPPPPVEQTS